MTSVEPSYPRLVPKLLVLATSIFVVSTNGLLVAGILRPLGRTFAADATQVGLTITWYSVAVAILSPVVGIALARVPRGAILAVQLVVFAVGAARGVQHTPYSWLFRTLVRPRLAPTGEREDPAPPRFAQAVGLAFAVVGLATSLLGWTLVGLVAVACALVAAALNATTGFCLGCEVYLLLIRLTH